jgi:para-aminobenzoate synthetase component 1
MKFIDKQKAVSLMNLMGEEMQPFFFMIDYAEVNCFVSPLPEISSEEVLYDFKGKTNTSSKRILIRNVEWKSFPMNEEEYAKGFNNVVNEINKGNSYLVNYTCSTPIETNLTLEDIFYSAKAPYRLLVKDSFVVFSPEIFVKIHGGHIYSYPMKGTIDASIPNASSVILNDEKESAEHATIVDLIRNDISMVADRVHVSKYRYLDEIETNDGTLLQVSSEIKGRLAEDWNRHVGDIMFSLLPAGSISGAPKKKTLEIISNSESYDRGFYTGVMGLFDGENLDSAVMIRFVENVGGGLVFKSGGGITSRSDMKMEYEEMKRKVYVPFDVFGND